MPSPSPPSPIDAARLYEAALTYLGRYASTEASLRRILNRKVDRWANMQPEDASAAILAAREAIDLIVERLLRAGLLNDSGFAELRAKTLARNGQSSRSIHARLMAKGVSPDIARAAAPHDEKVELAAAIVMARRRRIGPYRTADGIDATGRLKELARLARAGFARDIAERVLDMALEEAERRVLGLRG